MGVHAQGREALTFAGMWERWRPTESEPVESFTIVTQPAGAELNAYHDRAPVVIWPADRDRWMDPAADPLPFIGAQSAERFDVRKTSDAEITAEMA